MATHPVGPYQRPGPAKKRPSKFDRTVAPTPMPAAQTAPPPDKAVLVHDCFAQETGESRPHDCGCTDYERNHVNKLDAQALVTNKKADWLTYKRGEKVVISATAIVLRREYVSQLLTRAKIIPSQLISELVKQPSISFKDGIIRAPNGTSIVVEMESTDVHYWRKLLVDLGLGMNATRFLKEAAEGMGLPVSFTKFENWQIAPHSPVEGIDPEVEEVIASELADRRKEIEQSRKKAGAAGFVRGSGGLRHTEWGKVKKGKTVWNAGDGPESDRIQEAYEREETTEDPER